MLDAFIVENRVEIMHRCRTKVAMRAVPAATAVEIEPGVAAFLDELVQVVRQRPPTNQKIGQRAALHGQVLHEHGFSVSQVVHGYGDVCQAITDLALDLKASISVEDFRTLNRCLDDAIACSVTEYCQGSQSVLDAGTLRADERLGFLAHEIRNLVGTASIAFEVLRAGNVGIAGSTGTVLQRSLLSLRELIDRSVAEVRLRRDVRDRTRFSVAEFIAELAPSAALDASARGLSFTVEPGDAAVKVEADRPILSAAVVNLLQNAFKFTRPGTTVRLRGRATPDRALIDVEDECGGLPDGDVEDLFEAFEQRGTDRTGLGLGLSISRWGVETNDGRISATNRPGHGCVFTVSLPREGPLSSSPPGE